MFMRGAQNERNTLQDLWILWGVYEYRDFLDDGENMKKRIKRILITTLFCILIIIIFTVIFFSVGVINGINYPQAAVSIPTKSENNYTITITQISFDLNPADIRWQMLDSQGKIEAEATFPTASGNTGDITNNNITITWFDVDNNSKLSGTDKIVIYTPSNTLYHHTLRLIYTPYGYLFVSISFRD